MNQNLHDVKFGVEVMFCRIIGEFANSLTIGEFAALCGVKNELIDEIDATIEIEAEAPVSIGTIKLVKG